MLYVKNKYVIPIFFIIILTDATTVILNKCCSQSDYMNSLLACGPEPELEPEDGEEEEESEESEGFEVRDLTTLNLTWFPQEALRNAKSLQPMNGDEVFDTMEWLVRVAEINYNMMPTCVAPHKLEFTFYAEGHEFFNLVTEPGKSMRLYIAPPDISGAKGSSIDDKWLLPLSDVCIDVIRDVGHILAYCPSNTSTWIRKCCPVRHWLNATTNTCEKIPGHYFITDWKPHPNVTKPNVLTGRTPSCETHTMLRSKEKDHRCRGFTDPDTKFTVFSNGTLKTSGKLYHTHQYCGEKTWHPGGHIYHQNILICGTKEDRSVAKIVYGTFFFIGVVLLIITVGTSLLLPELRRRTHNKIAITHNATLMVAYFTWGMSQLLPPVSIAACSIISLIIQFTFLGSLFWLNAMCLDMSSAFKTTTSMSSRSEKSDTRRYIIYSLYAWGFTSTVSIITMSMEFSENRPNGIPRPGFSCYCGFAKHTTSVLVYFYGPMAIILTFNTVLYAFTMWKIISVQRQTRQILHHTDSTTIGGQTDRQRLILYTKLFLLMGLTWVSEIIGWAVGGVSWFWILLDVINILRAVFIFIIFICRRQVYYSLKRRFNMTSGIFQRTLSSTTDAVSLSTLAPSRKTSHEEASRKRSREQMVKEFTMSKRRSWEERSKRYDGEELVENVDRVEEDDLLPNELVKNGNVVL